MSYGGGSHPCPRSGSAGRVVLSREDKEAAKLGLSVFTVITSKWDVVAGSVYLFLLRARVWVVSRLPLGALPASWPRTPGLVLPGESCTPPRVAPSAAPPRGEQSPRGLTVPEEAPAGGEGEGRAGVRAGWLSATGLGVLCTAGYHSSQ